MDNDGYLDILTMKNYNTVLILLNNTNTAFDRVVEVSLPYRAEKIYKLDLDNNGYLDILVPEEEGYKSYLRTIYFYDNLNHCCPVKIERSSLKLLKHS